MLKGYVEMALSHGCDVLKAVLPLMLCQSAKIGLIWLWKGKSKIFITKPSVLPPNSVYSSSSIDFWGKINFEESKGFSELGANLGFFREEKKKKYWPYGF